MTQHNDLIGQKLSVVYHQYSLIFDLSVDNLGKINRGDKHIKRPFSSNINEFKNFLAVRNEIIIKMAGNCVFFAKIGYNGFFRGNSPLETNLFNTTKMGGIRNYLTNLFQPIQSGQYEWIFWGNSPALGTGEYFPGT